MRKANNLPPSCAVVAKSGNLNLLEPSGTALPFYMKQTVFLGYITWKLFRSYSLLHEMPFPVLNVLYFYISTS